MEPGLIFTNRSRAQLTRRSQENKAQTLELKAKVAQFQGLINQLQSQKQAQLAEKERLINQLATEVSEMSSQLDNLSDAFGAVGDLESEMQRHWGLISFPSRFLDLFRAIKSLMQWWKSQDDGDKTEKALAESPVMIVHADEDDEQDRRDRPQLYTDQASINRSLLDP